jgi:hypothetical protein
MAIYLDEQTRPYLERMFATIHSKDFIGLRIKGQLVSDRKRLEEIAKCDHVAGSYTGHKECCTKCGAKYVPGQSEGWQLNDN